MAFILTTKSLLKCSHGGVIRLASSQSRLNIGDDSVLVQGDLNEAIVDDCPIVDSSSTRQCRRVKTVVGGVSAVLAVDDKPVLLSDARGLTKGSDESVSGTWTVDVEQPTRINQE